MRRNMRSKTHPFKDAGYNEEEEEEDVDERNLSQLPNFTKSPLIITKKMISKNKNIKKKKKKKISSSALSSSSKSDHSQMMTKPTKTTLGSSLMAPPPLSPSPLYSSPSQTFSSPSSPLPSQSHFSRASGEFFTPIHQSSSVCSNMSMKKHELSPKCLSISTIYESAIEHGHRGKPFDSHVRNLKHLHIYESSSTTTTTSGDFAVSFPALPSVPEEMAGHRGRRRQSGRSKEEEEVVEEEEDYHLTPVNRPKPYQEFLDEVQKHKKRSELGAQKKAVYTHLLDQLRRKEAAIDDWELNHRSKLVLQLDKLERELEKKRSKAVQKMHQKVAETNMEAERRKEKERRCFLKKFDKLSGKIHENKVRARIVFRTWSCCCIPSSVDTP